MSEALLLTLIGDMVRDAAATLSSDARGRALDLAVGQYGRDCPRTITVDVEAEGGNYLDYPAGFDAAVGAVTAIEYPIGQVPPCHLSADQWMDYQTPDGPQILSAVSFAAGADVRVGYTAPWNVEDIPAVDYEAVASYAAAILHDQLASAKSGDSDSMLAADSVRSGAKGKEYAERAASLRQRYHDLLGIDPKRVVPASTMVQASSTAGDGGRRLWNWRGRP